MNFQERERNGVAYWVIEEWESIPHGFCGNGLDLSGADDAWQRVFPELHLHQLDQKHSKKVIRPPIPEGRPEADGWLGLPEPGHVFGIRTADCFPVLIRSKTAPAVAALHAGWRGAAAGIVVDSIVGMTRSGIPARSLELAIGPGAQACCYEIGKDVADHLMMVFEFVNSPPASRVEPAVLERDGKRYGNIRDLIIAQAVFCGIPREQIAFHPSCTICDNRFFSHRRGETGRQISFIGASGEPSSS